MPYQTNADAGYDAWKLESPYDEADRETDREQHCPLCGNVLNCYGCICDQTKQE